MALLDDYLALREQIATDIRAAWQFTAGDKIYFAPMETDNYRGERFAFITPGAAFSEDYSSAGVQGQNQLTWTMDIVGSFKRQDGDLIDDFCAEKAFALRAELHSGSSAPGYANVATLWIVREVDWRISDPTEDWMRVLVKVEFIVVADRVDS